MNNQQSEIKHTTRRRWAGSMLWDGQALEQADDWMIDISASEVAEIQQLINAPDLADKPIGELTQSDFDFRHFGDRLLSLRKDVLEGRGFAVLRGLPADWSDRDLTLAYWAIGSWFGQPVSQNGKAHLLGHVINLRQTATGETRIYQTSKAQPFHSDSCDIVGLLCLRPAHKGGASSIASSAAIHNKLLDENPAALDALYGQFLCDRYGEIPEGKLPYYPLHVFNDIDDKLVCCGMDHDIRSAQRLDNVTTLTAEQLHALDAFQNAAKKLALNMSLARGDIQLVNNHIVVHARESFEDYSDRDKRRYLIRLWLSSPIGRTLPDFLAERWGNIEVGSLRGGIRVPGAVPAVHLDPDH